MAVETPDLNQIAVVLSQLVQNYNELAQNWFNIFYNPEEMDITIKFFDTDGNIQTYTLPNRAKDLRYVLNGQGSPEGVATAKAGAIYQDLLNGDLYIKRSGDGNTGWQRMMSLNEVYSSGQGSPEGVVYGKKGDMYVDLDTGMLYTKTTSTGTTGWSLAGATGKADQVYVDNKFNEVYDNLDTLNQEINNGVVHKTGGPETISSEKTFTGGANFDSVTTFNAEATFTKVINGTAYRALSADIAEYYNADQELLPGTLIMFDGINEITKARGEVHGVVSTNPAYVLNDKKEMDYPTLVALTGRVPVRVIGPVHKFDKISLSSIEGVARVDNTHKPCYNIIGKALETNLEEGEKLVECVVKISL